MHYDGEKSGNNSSTTLNVWLVRQGGNDTESSNRTMAQEKKRPETDLHVCRHLVEAKLAPQISTERTVSISWAASICSLY